MDTDRITGTARDMAGRAQEAAGDALGDTRTRARGIANQGYGAAQDSVGQLNDAIREQPLLAAVVALGVGFLIGRLTS